MTKKSKDLKKITIITINPGSHDEIFRIFEKYGPGLEFIHKIESKNNPETLIFTKPIDKNLLEKINQKKNKGICTVHKLDKEIVEEISKNVVQTILPLLDILKSLGIFSALGGTGGGRP